MPSDISYEIARLNRQQREAVLHMDGPLLVLAGAGSGKTRVITTRITSLIRSGVCPEKILAVTFTNKAAKEMKGRVASLLGGLGGKKGKGPVISTFHSLCLKILRSEIEHLGYRRDFSIYDTSDQASLMRNLMTDVKLADKSVKVESVMERISRAKNGFTPSSEIETDEDDHLGAISLSLHERYQKALKAFNAVDFDDLLLLTLKLFKEHPDLLSEYQERYKYIMVDEYQDTNRVQYDLIRLLAGEKKNLCVVGDDDQSIYGWRGADIGNILDFDKDFPGAKIVKLEQNYRSFGHILKAANGVIKNNSKRMVKALRTKAGPGPLVNLLKSAGSEEEAKWVAERVALIKYEKKVRYEDMAIIYRANNLSRPFEEALRRERIPYTVIGGTSYFERREIKDLVAYLKVIANHGDDLSLIRAVSNPKRGIGPTTLEKLGTYSGENSISTLEAFRSAEKADGISDNVARVTIEFADLIDRYTKRLVSGVEMAGVVKELVREIRYKDFIFEIYKTPDAAAKRVENIEGFIESISNYELKESSPTLQGFLEAMALTDIEESKEDDIYGVTLISLHSSKGLEFPVVFIVGAEEEILPHKKSILSGDIEEERRLMYVGITRAMKDLYITYTGQRIKYGKEIPSTPSRFIDEIPEGVIKDLDNAGDAAPEEAEKKAKDFFSNIHAMLGD